VKSIWQGTLQRKFYLRMLRIVHERDEVMNWRYLIENKDQGVLERREH